MITIWDCSVEGCNRPAESGGTLCATHSREARKAATPKPKARRARISKHSEEGKERIAVYDGIRALFLKDQDICERCLLEYSVWMKATQVHHRRGRLGDNLYDVRYFLPVCAPCHQYIETHPEEAYERGWSMLRTQTEPHAI